MNQGKVPRYRRSTEKLPPSLFGRNTRPRITIKETEICISFVNLAFVGSASSALVDNRYFVHFHFRGLSFDDQ
jgi:hypothetical protein